MKKSKFPQSLRFQHNGSSLACTTGVKYVEKLDGYFFLHWESLWPGVGSVVYCVCWAGAASADAVMHNKEYKVN